MGEERWQEESPWWHQEHHHQHMFSSYKPPQNTMAGGSYSNQPSSYWWCPTPQIDNNSVGTVHHNQQHNVATRGAMPKMVKGSETKPRGRMTAYAFFVQICREEHKKKHPEENVVFAEFSKKCAERWKTMTEKDKKRFHDLADKDKKRYESEMKDYTPSENDKGKRGKKRKQIKDPNAPKRPLSAFFLFSIDERSNVKQANPEYTAGDTSKELGRRWSEANPNVKGKYQEMADKDKLRYDREITEYKKRGKFTSSAALAAKKKESDEEEEEEEEDDE